MLFRLTRKGIINRPIPDHQQRILFRIITADAFPQGATPVHARKYTSLLKSVLAKNQLSKGAATTTATSLLQHGHIPSPFADVKGVKDQERPQETEAPSEMAEIMMQADIEWERWVNLDMCDIDSTQEIGYDATPPRKMSVRPVDLEGNYGLVVES
ncbi:MAG: hypothetical protein Q9208_001226 [Pyrenodesmia sp. 3 TL-2023]